MGDMSSSSNVSILDEFLENRSTLSNRAVSVMKTAVGH